MKDLEQKSENFYEKYVHESLPVAVTKEGTDHSKNPLVVQVLDIQATSVPKIKSIGPSLRK